MMSPPNLCPASVNRVWLRATSAPSASLSALMRAILTGYAARVQIDERHPVVADRNLPTGAMANQVRLTLRRA